MSGERATEGFMSGGGSHQGLQDGCHMEKMLEADRYQLPGVSGLKGSSLVSPICACLLSKVYIRLACDTQSLVCASYIS
jgi:hypothetical protein